LTVDGAHVYWANSKSGTIGRANTDGTGVNEFFISAGSQNGSRSGNLKAACNSLGAYVNEVRRSNGSQAR